MSVERTKKMNILLIILVVLLLLGVIGWWISSSINERYLQSDPKLQHLKEILSPLSPKVKDLKLYKGKKSYTINKEKIYLCLTDDKGNYYDDNVLIYVLIHEITHMANKDDIGHTEKFHKIFQDLLDKASDLNIYNPSIPMIQNYCTHGIDTDDDTTD